MTLKVGITGGIGSGKSTVCKTLEMLGFPVYFADIEARKITENNPEVIAAISGLFGTDIYVSGNLNRKRVASMVFNDKLLLEQLNSIVHPAVANHFDMWVAKSESSIVFKEAAILFESGAYKQLNKNVVVIAPETVRINRVINRDAVTFDDVKKRMANQFPQEKLIAMADYVIDNDCDKLIVPQILCIVEYLKRLL